MIEEKINDQLVCLDLSQQLKEAGYPQKGYWHWVQWRPYENEGGWDPTHLTHRPMLNDVVAPTLAELGRALPNNVVDIIEGESFDDMDLYSDYRDLDRVLYSPDFLAKLWLYLKKEGKL